MAITRENVEYIANLARLDPKGEGFDKIAEDMQSIVAMVDQLQELDLGDITDVIDKKQKNAKIKSENRASHKKIPTVGLKSAVRSGQTVFIHYLLREFLPA